MNCETFIVDEADVFHRLGQHGHLICVCDVTLNWQLKSNLTLTSILKMNPLLLRVLRVERVIRHSYSVLLVSGGSGLRSGRDRM